MRRSEYERTKRDLKKVEDHLEELTTQPDGCDSKVGGPNLLGLLRAPRSATVCVLRVRVSKTAIPCSACQLQQTGLRFWLATKKNVPRLRFNATTQLLRPSRRCQTLPDKQQKRWPTQTLVGPYSPLAIVTNPQRTARLGVWWQCSHRTNRGVLYVACATMPAEHRASAKGEATQKRLEIYKSYNCDRTEVLAGTEEKGQVYDVGEAVMKNIGTQLVCLFPCHRRRQQSGIFIFLYLYIYIICIFSFEQLQKQDIYFFQYIVFCMVHHYFGIVAF